MECIRCRKSLPEGAKYCPSCGKKQVQEKRKALKRANGTGTVYKLEGRRRRPWVAAKQRIVIGYYEKKTEAMEALERAAGKGITDRYNMSFAEVFDSWKAEHYPSLGESGITAYNRAYAVFSPLHERKFRELRTKDYQAVLEEYKDKSYSTLSKHKQLLTQMSEWAIREELIGTNFGKYVKLPEQEKHEKAIFTEEEIAKLELDGSEAAKIVLMLLATGMRIGELFSLTCEDYHGSYVIGGSKTEAGRSRVIPIRPEGRAKFAYFAAQADGTQLLSGYTGQHIAKNYRSRDYYPLLERLGIERKSPHATRHTYTTRAVKEGMAPEILQKILGHANYATTANVYTHMDIQTLITAVERGSGN